VALLDVLDTAGLEEYSAMREQYMRTGEGFMLVYSIASRQSFEEIETFRRQILRIKDKEYFPMIVVGHQCERESERQVAKQEGEEMARLAGYPFLEVSSKERINVDQAFYGLVRDIRKYNRQLGPNIPKAFQEQTATESKPTPPPSSYNRLKDFLRRQRGAK
jgi:GTPase KRas protein